MIDLIFELGEAEITCDECGYEETFDGFDGKINIYEVIDYMKEDGWKIYKDKNDWQHICPECNNQ